MDRKSLAGLKESFEKWRSRKRYLREAVPADLLERARKAALWHGPAAVARVTKLDRSRLKIGKGSRPATRRTAAVVPAFSRMELAAPAVAIRPFAEVETTAGVKLRLFTATDQVLGLR